MKKSWMVLAILLAGTESVRAEDLVIQSLETDGTITFNALSNATAYQVAEEIDGVWTNLVSIPGGGIGTVTATVSMVDESTLYCIEATVPTSPEPAGMVLIPGGTNSGTNPLASGESHSSDYPATYELTVESFYLDRYEVTKALWDEVKTWGESNGYFMAIGYGKAHRSSILVAGPQSLRA